MTKVISETKGAVELQVSNQEIHGYSESGGNPVNDLPRGMKSFIRTEYDNSVNTKGEKILPHFGADVMPAYREYLSRNPDKSASFRSFMTFTMKNTWTNKFGEAKGEVMYHVAQEALCDRLEDRMLAFGAGSVKHNEVRKHAEIFLRYIMKTTYEGMLAEEVAINEVANHLGLMDREISETRHEEVSQIDGYVGDQEVQVKHISEAKHYSGEPALVTWEKVPEKNNSDKSIKLTFNPADFSEAKDTKSDESFAETIAPVKSEESEKTCKADGCSNEAEIIQIVDGDFQARCHDCEVDNSPLTKDI